MVKLSLNFGKTRPEMTGESKQLYEFGNELVQFASENNEKIGKFCKKTSTSQEEGVAKWSFGFIDKTAQILNQFVILVEQLHHDETATKIMIQHLGVFLMLIGAQVDICSAIAFAVLDQQFRHCKNAEKLGSVAVQLAECLRLQEERLPRLEQRILEAAERMFGIGRAIRGPDGNLQKSFGQLRREVLLIKTDSAECDEKVSTTFTKIKKTLVTPEKRKKIIRWATAVGAIIGLVISIICTWYAGWGLALLGILIGTTASAIVGAFAGFTIVNRRDTNLLEDLLKCSNQRDHLRKNFENFKFRMQNDQCYLKYADAEYVEIDLSTQGSEC